MQSKVRHADRKHFLSADILTLQQQLDKLTMENRPENLLKYMLKESRFDS